MNDDITNEQVEHLLSHPICSRIQRQILEGVGKSKLPVLSAAVGTLGVELHLAGISEKRAVEMLETHERQLIDFGVAFMRSEWDLPSEEEYGPGEEGQQDDISAINVLGIGDGFALTHVCYFSFLLKKDYEGFLRYCKGGRIPGAKKFLGRLKKVFSDVFDT